MLQSTRRVQVVSEPLAVQDLLSREVGTPAQRRGWLRSLIGLYYKEPLVIKWSSGCTRFMTEIQEAFPATPCVFVHRDPVEVLASCLEGPPLGWERATGPDFAPHLQPQEGEEFVQRMARYLGSVCYFARRGQALQLWDYQGLAARVLGDISAHFCLALSSAELEAMQLNSRFYSKASGKLFDGEEEKRRRSRQELELAERFVMPELRALLREKSSH